MRHNQIHARMIERGTSFTRWAVDNGYNPRSVTQAVKRWAGADTLPRGRLTFRILQDLSVFIGAEILPGLLDEKKPKAS